MEECKKYTVYTFWILRSQIWYPNIYHNYHHHHSNNTLSLIVEIYRVISWSLGNCVTWFTIHFTTFMCPFLKAAIKHETCKWSVTCHTDGKYCPSCSIRYVPVYMVCVVLENAMESKNIKHPLPWIQMLEMDSSWTDIFLSWNSRMYKFMVVNGWNNSVSEAGSYGHL